MFILERKTWKSTIGKEMTKSMSDFAEKHPDLSTNLYSKCLTLNDTCKNFLSPPEHAELYIRRSRAFLRQHDAARALDDALHSVAVYPKFYEVWGTQNIFSLFRVVGSPQHSGAQDELVSITFSHFTEIPVILLMHNHDYTKWLKGCPSTSRRQFVKQQWSSCELTIWTCLRMF